MQPSWTHTHTRIAFPDGTVARQVDVYYPSSNAGQQHSLAAEKPAVCSLAESLHRHPLSESSRHAYRVKPFGGGTLQRARVRSAVAPSSDRDGRRRARRSGSCSLGTSRDQQDNTSDWRHVAPSMSSLSLVFHPAPTSTRAIGYSLRTTRSATAREE